MIINTLTISLKERKPINSSRAVQHGLILSRVVFTLVFFTRVKILFFYSCTSNGRKVYAHRAAAQLRDDILTIDVGIITVPMILQTINNFMSQIYFTTLRHATYVAPPWGF